jgi:UDP-N-acetylmuramate--alanine ligase
MTKQHIHFLGIGGIGVSALAQLAIARGALVSGSDTSVDLTANPALSRLVNSGAVVYQGHRADHIADSVSLVVATAAVNSENPEIREAMSRGIRCVSRAEYLGEVMAEHKGPTIAVAGTHGKTTTTGMLGVMLQEAGMDPTVFVGGEIPQLGGNLRIGSPEGPFIAEACEAYDSFLTLRPDIAIICNCEPDHLDHFHDADGVYQAFTRFIKNVKHGGMVAMCMDDPGVRRLEASRDWEVDFCNYGIEFGVDTPDGLYFTGAVSEGKNPAFTVTYRGEECHIRMGVPGKHNALNALAALVVAARLKVPADKIARGVGAFTGAGRRQEMLAEIGTGQSSILVMDDYAHHPTEIRATLSAIKAAYPNRRIAAVFQPHLYSRTRDFMQEFASSLSAVDVLIVTGIYAAREAPIPGVRAADIVTGAADLKPELISIYVPDRHDVPRTLAAMVTPGDMVLFMGAGDIREQADEFVQKLRVRGGV